MTVVIVLKKWPLEYQMVTKTYLATYLWDSSDSSDCFDSSDSSDSNDSSDNFFLSQLFFLDNFFSSTFFVNKIHKKLESWQNSKCDNIKK